MGPKKAKILANNRCRQLFSLFPPSKPVIGKDFHYFWSQFSLFGSQWFGESNHISTLNCYLAFYFGFLAFSLSPLPTPVIGWDFRFFGSQFSLFGHSLVSLIIILHIYTTKMFLAFIFAFFSPPPLFLISTKKTKFFFRSVDMLYNN